MNTEKEISEALAGGYLLADVTIRRFSGFKKDKAASVKVTHDAGATNNSAKVVKDVLAGARAELKEVAATQDAIRSFLYTNTLPWSASNDGRTTGARLLPAVKSIDFLKTYKVMHTAYVVALADFIAVYDSRRAQAMQNLAGLANPNDYPDKVEIETMFAVDIDLSPVPAPTDFNRLSVPIELSTVLGDRIAKQQGKAMENAMTDLSDRIVTELKRMATQLGKHGKGEKTRLYGSLLGNMEGLADLLRSSNFANDEGLDKLADKLAECTQYDLETIKANPTIAAKVAVMASEITNDIESDLYF
jgi:hypothetical protein